MHIQAERIIIQVTSPTALDEQLNAAVQGLQKAAMREMTRGILVTRQLPGRYVVELSSSVPFGLTRELMI